MVSHEHSRRSLPQVSYSKWRSVFLKRRTEFQCNSDLSREDFRDLETGTRYARSKVHPQYDTNIVTRGTDFPTILPR
jgi:hypothetical protein